ncbi:MAG: hypothetical protein ABSE68_01410 [Minisyncoccia bacterium]
MSDLIAFRNEKLWRWLTNFWTLVFMVFLVANFFTGNSYDFLIAPFSVIYVGILGLYVGTKEFDRWYDLHESRHPGELFVIAWTVVIFSLLALSVAIRDGHKVSSEAIAVYIMVLSVFALTQKSKKLHQRKKNGRH